MRSPDSYYKAAAALCVFFVLVFAVAFAFNPYYPLLVITGESSVGTWMSGVLLIVATTVSLITGMRKGWFPWFLLAAFLSVLALDERFMFHERIKERIIFSFSPAPAPWLYELPVIAGACMGAVIAFLLWHHLRGASRMLLVGAVILGSASVAIDVLATGVLWEECSKLVAELLIACALLSEVDK
jgi:hypothetical protein